MTVLIAGAGIAGLTFALSLADVGVPFRVFEKVKSPKPLGVGINLQPPAVRELMEMGLTHVLDIVGVQTQDYGFYTRTGVEIWTEPRGLEAGYNWPQYSVHRGQLQMAMWNELVARCGDAVVTTDAAVSGYRNTDRGVSLLLDDGRAFDGTALVGADGIHSAIRAQMYPNEGPPIWNGAIMWRGTTLAKPFLSGASMILAGHDTQRFVSYPITHTDPETGLAVLNWIAEKTVDPNSGVSKEDWNRNVSVDAFLPDFEGWVFDWLDVPQLIRGAGDVYEYPMVDRNPLEAWRDGHVTLIGDAAHPTYPVGSSGASQAILDARILAATLKSNSDVVKALSAYEAQVKPIANRVTLANRGSGPDAIMQMAEDRCCSDFSDLDEKLPYEERASHAAEYKRLAGMTPDALNARSSILSS